MEGEEWWKKALRRGHSSVAQRRPLEQKWRSSPSSRAAPSNSRERSVSVVWCDELVIF